jgi:hypothetical protein
MNYRILFILFGLLIFSCEKDNKLEERNVTLINELYFKPIEYSVVQDSILDVDLGFINLDKLKIYISEDSIEISIGILNLPDKLTFNSADLSANFLNYEWSVNFDNNNDNQDSKGDLIISISKFKFSEELTGEILSITQEDIWQRNEDGAFRLKSISNYVKKINNSFSIKIPKNISNELKLITSNTGVYFKTYYSDGNKISYDYYPPRVN